MPRLRPQRVNALRNLQLWSGRSPRNPRGSSLWSQALIRTVAHYNDLKAWTDLLMLPQCVLGAPPRSGRGHRRAAAADTLDRLRPWTEGERRSL